jgi:hypothetical protein
MFVTSDGIGPNLAYFFVAEVPAISGCRDEAQ